MADDPQRGLRKRERELQLIAVLVARTEWRKGSISDRLREVEHRAKWRAKTGAYNCDVKMERKLAKLARRVRKARDRG